MRPKCRTQSGSAVTILLVVFLTAVFRAQPGPLHRDRRPRDWPPCSGADGRGGGTCKVRLGLQEGLSSA